MAALTFTSEFDAAFFDGTSGVTTLVPSPYDVALNGRPYMLQLEPNSIEKWGQHFLRESLPLVRDQSDQSDEPGEQCVDETTEILTARGWLTHDKVREGDFALTLNHVTGMSEWQPIDKIFRYAVTGRRMLALNSKQHSSLTTDNHRWPVLHKTHTDGLEATERRFCTSSQLSTSHRIQLAAECATRPAEAKYDDALVELVAWYWTEGSLSYNAAGGVRRLTIGQSNNANAPKVDRIRAALTRLYGPERKGETWYEYHHPRKGMRLFHLVPALAQPIIDAAPAKVVRPDFITALTGAQLDMFVNVSIMADGTRAKNGITCYLAQKRKDMADAFQFACVLAGRRTAQRQIKDGKWLVTVSESWSSYTNPMQNAREVGRSSAEWVEYTGTVWCPNVENSTWLARRDGMVYFTGNSVSPEQFWRRSQQSWHKGAGQSWLDWANTSDRNRFRSSKGVNPWVEKTLTLHNATASAKTSANTSLSLCMAGARCYFGSGTGQATYFSTDASTWTAVTGTPAATVSSVTSDGFTVYLAYNASGIYKTDTSTGAAASWATGTVSLVGYVKGRLMAANGPNLYNVVAAGALPAALFTHANSDFAWVGFTEGPGFIYAAGFSGGHSEIYSITLTDTASVLAAPKIAAELPEGEIVRSVKGYLGFMVIGTDKGVRLATINSDGSLILGGLINTGSSVRCLSAQDRFVWFGWTNYDGTSTGLGRVDLSVFTSTLVPAYASDLMATTQGVVSATVLLAGTRLFTVEGVGVYKETPGTVVASGTLDTGFIGYDLADEKQAVFFDLRHEPLPTGATVSVGLAVDGGTFTAEGTSSIVSSTAPAAFYLNGQQGERFEVRMTLTASGSSPTLTRWTLRADVTAQPTSMFTVPLMITDRSNVHGSDYAADAHGDVAALIALHDNQTIFAYQEGIDTYQVKLVAYAWLPQQRSADTQGVFNGTFVANLRHVTG